MAKPAIIVDGLSKKYKIGLREKANRTFGEALVDVLKAPIRRFRSLGTAANGDDTFWALKDVSFEVQPGEVVGIIGRNGAGKSTLLKILSRITEPTTGRAVIRGRVGSLLEVGTGFHPELTGRENIYLNGAILGMKRAEISRKFDEIVAFAEIDRFLDTPVKRYSSGMYVRLAFAVAAHLEPEILIVDEVLAVGDAEFQRKCLGKMKDVASGGRTVLFVSHNMTVLRRLCTRGMLIQKGKVATTGATDRIVDAYERSYARQMHGQAGSVVYEGSEDGKEFQIRRIEIVDEQGLPKHPLCSGQSVTFRITYYAGREIRVGSVVLRIGTSDGMTLLLSATEPDSGLPYTLRRGVNQVAVSYEVLPLSAGQYSVGAGLAVPRREWLCWNESLAQFVVQESDIYGSGFAPTKDRCLLALRTTWSL